MSSRVATPSVRSVWVKVAAEIGQLHEIGKLS
jgi:hypothetical protein